MTLDEVAAFLAIHDYQGVVKAADHLGRSQPAISRRLDQLEASLGSTLIERSPSTGYMGLTEAGRALLPFARTMLAASSDACDAVREINHADGGEVAFAIVGTLVDSSLSSIVRQFAAKAPKAELRLVTANSAEISSMVRSGCANVGMKYGDESDAYLEAISAGKEELIAVISPEYRDRLRGKGTDKLAGAVWFGFPASPHAGSFGTKLLELIAEHRLQGCDVRAVDSLSAQLCLAEAGLGIALLPTTFISDALSRGSVVWASGALRTTIPITLIHRRNGHLSAAARCLIDLAQVWRGR